MTIISVSSHENLLRTLKSKGHYLPAICGGRGSCGKCAVRLVSGSLDVSDADRKRFSQEELDKGWRLACTAFPSGEIRVEIPDTGEQHFSIVSSFTETDIATRKRDAEYVPIGSKEESFYGIAVDIGTTTIDMVLLEVHTGKIIARHAVVNKQREFGADVISRIQSANDGNLSVLSGSVRKQIDEGIAALCSQAQISSKDICKVVITGNTTMLHLLLGLSCNTLGKAPFTPVTLDMVFMQYREICNGDLSCEVIVLPGISTYVGADITAGIYFTELHQSTAPAMLVDIGTNGEMVLVNKGKILCTATAAGPAFEGGNILWGTGSVPGAISHVQYNNGIFAVQTIEE